MLEHMKEVGGTGVEVVQDELGKVVRGCGMVPNLLHQLHRRDLEVERWSLGQVDQQRTVLQEVKGSYAKLM
jgi:hypothetical protein